MCCRLIAKFEAGSWRFIFIVVFSWLVRFSSTSEGTMGKKGFVVTVVNIDAVCSRVRGLGGRESCRDGSSWGRSRSSSQDAPSV